MRLKSCWAIAMLLVIGSIQAGSRQYDEVLLQKAFLQVDSVCRETLAIPDTIRHQAKREGLGNFQDTDVAFYRVFFQARIIGYGFGASIRSKSSVISVLVCLDTNGVIVRLELPDTPDPISSRLQSPAWKKQFHDKSTIGRIDAVSGATISSSDVAMTVRAILMFFRKLHTLPLTDCK